MEVNYFMDTQMSMIIFFITSFEIVIFAIQLVYCLYRPDDKLRIYYAILLFFLIQYNIISALFPDENIVEISIFFQNILAYSSGILMSIYIPLYISLAFDLKKLKWLATYGVLFFIILPFILLFLIIYTFTNDLDLARKLLVVIPFIYGIFLIINTYTSFKEKYKSIKKSYYLKIKKQEILVVYLAIFFWMFLPIITFLGGNQLMEQTITNLGFIVMTIAYVRLQINFSKKEYKTFLQKSKLVKKLNLEIVELNIHKNDAKISLNQEFSEFLKNKFTTLNSSDRKYIEYLNFGLTSKEYSILTNKSMDSLKTQRYRIRQKLGLKNEKNILKHINY